MALQQAILMIFLPPLQLVTACPFADMGSFYMSNRQLHRDVPGYKTPKGLRGTSCPCCETHVSIQLKIWGAVERWRVLASLYMKKQPKLVFFQAVV